MKGSIVMSEEKETNVQECLKLDMKDLEQIAGGGDDDTIELIEVKPRCPYCRSNRYYSYILYYMGKEYTVYQCPDCGYKKRTQE